MKERRHSERVKCRFKCDLVRGRQTIPGTVVDISSGGLAVRAEGGLQQGDPVEVQMTVPGRGTVTVEAIAWHVRRARLRESGDTVYLLGMMLSKAPDLYFTLARGARPAIKRSKRGADASRATAASPADTRGQPPPGNGSTAGPSPTTSPAVPIACDLTPFRVRLKHRASPRTRVVSIDAASYGEAREIATEQLGEEWEILDAGGGRRG